MSTKIYNGLKINAPSIDKAFVLLQGLRQEFIDHVYEDLRIRSINKISSKINSVFIQKYLTEELGISFSVSENDNYVRDFDSLKSSSIIESSVNLFRDECYNKQNNDEIIIHPCQDGKNYCLGAYLMADEHIDFLYKKSSGVISNYIYYNNSDQPDDMTEEEWDKRGQEWDKTLGDSSFHRSCGVSYQMIDYRFFNHSLLFNDLNTLNEKILDKFQNQERQAKSKDYYIDASRRIFMSYLDNNGFTGSVSDIMQASRNAKKGIFKDEDQKKVFNLILKIVENFDANDFVLEKKLIVDDLYRKFRDATKLEEKCIPKITDSKSKMKL